jgi:hypothetical protein
MDFTEVYKQSNGLVSFSYGGHFILTAAQDRLIVRRADTFQISRSWQVDSSPSATQSIFSTASTTRRAPETSPITHIGWSSDSEYVLAACAKLGVTYVFCMRDEQWNARIEAGAEGLVKAEWALDGRHVVCFSEWAVRGLILLPLQFVDRCIVASRDCMVAADRCTNIHSISITSRPWCVTNAYYATLYSIFFVCLGYTFRRDGRYFFLAERHKSKDTLGVYDAGNSFALVRVRIHSSYVLSLYTVEVQS